MVYCICRKPDNGDFMICCDVCEEWFHGKCVGISKKQSKVIKKYSCPKCVHRQPIVYSSKQYDSDEYSESEDEDEDEEIEVPSKRKKEDGGKGGEKGMPPRKVLKHGDGSIRSSQEVSSYNFIIFSFTKLFISLLHIILYLVLFSLSLSLSLSRSSPLSRELSLFAILS